MSAEQGFLQHFREYIADKAILIADPSSSARTAIARAVRELGAKTANLHLVSSFHSAVEKARQVTPKVVISDYNLGDRCGIALFERIQEIHGESPDTLYIVVTANSTESAVAEAAEEDVDSYILKPFTTEKLKIYVLRAAERKFRPDPYRKAIQDGKTLLKSGDLPKAAERFIAAAGLNQKPALAYYYHGQAKVKQTQYEPAEKSYRTGLTFNQLHYRCLTGLFDLLDLTGKHEAAYEVVETIVQYFPPSPQKLSRMIRLAVETDNFEDIEMFYQSFSSLDYKTDELVKCMGAALVVLGKYYLLRNRKDIALAVFRDAVTATSKNHGVLREIIFLATEQKCMEIAEEMLGQFPPEARDSGEYLGIEFLVDSALETPPRAIDRGRKLLGAGVHDPLIYEIMIRRSKEAGLDEAAEQLARDAVKRWEGQRERFMSLLAGGVVSSN